MNKDGESHQGRESAVRDRILATADELFYREGVRAVGVDTVVARSGVAKTSLYRWFPTKDDLVAAFLGRRNAQFWEQWDSIAHRHRGNPRAELSSHLQWIARYVASSQYRGCPFINTATEFPDPAHPGRAVCIANKTKLRERLLALAQALPGQDPELLADQLTLLIDGAFANAQVMGKASAARSLEAAGQALVAGAGQGQEVPS